MKVLINNGFIEEPVAATIGMFDGVHKGHRYILSHLKAQANKRNLKTAVITFSRHPQSVLHGYAEESLMTLDDRISAIGESGIDYVVVMDFTKELSLLTAQQFLQLLYKRYYVKLLITGYDHRFGHNRKETYNDYVKYGKEIGMDVVKCDEYTTGNEKISSSEIRKLITEGNVKTAAEMLQRPYKISGEVVDGFRNGRKIGFPTANIKTDGNIIIPSNGVYAVTVNLNDGYIKKGMLNIGIRPTFDNGKNRSVEVNIFDFSENIYGKQIEIMFYDRIRNERKMQSLEELEKQLENDRITAKEILKNYRL